MNQRKYISMKKVVRWFARLARDEIVARLLSSPFFWGIVIGGATAFAAWTRNAPIDLIILGTLAAVTLVFVLLGANSVRRSLSSPKFKIVVEAAQPLHWGESDIQKIQGVLLIRNLGNFPIQVDCTDVKWVMDNRTGEERADILKTAIVSPMGQQFLNGPVFSRNWQTLAEAEVFRANIDVNVVIKYGKPGNLKYEHNVPYSLSMTLSSQGNSTAWIGQKSIGRLA